MFVMRIARNAFDKHDTQYTYVIVEDLSPHCVLGDVPNLSYFQAAVSAEQIQAEPLTPLLQ